MRSRTEGSATPRPASIVKPSIAVVIPTHQCGAWLPRAVESVLAQTRKDFELAIVDDGSTDGTSRTVSKFLEDPRVRYLRHESRRGPSAARNTGIEATSAPLVTFLDADDHWSPEYLAVQAAALESGEVDVSCVAAVRLGFRGEEVQRKEPPLGGDALYEELLFANTIPASSSGIMIRRSCLDSVGVFDETLFATEDRDLWVRLAKECRFAFQDDPLATIERRRTSSAVHDRLRMAEGHEAFLRKREEDMPVRFRRLLPRLRRNTYLKVARMHLGVGDRDSARRYALRAVRALPRPDRDLRRCFSVLIRTLVPAALHGLDGRS